MTSTISLTQPFTAITALLVLTLVLRECMGLVGASRAAGDFKHSN
jgi:hypothetical protein